MFACTSFIDIRKSMRIAYNASLTTESHFILKYRIADVLSDCTSTLSPVSDGHRKSDQQLISYVEVHTDLQ
jgi:hypothetical protein